MRLRRRRWCRPGSARVCCSKWKWSRLRRIKAETGAAQIDFVAWAKTLAAQAVGRHLYGPAIAKDAGTVFAGVVADAVLRCLRVEHDVSVPARDIGAVFEDDIVAANDPMLRIGQLRHAAYIRARLFQYEFILIGFTADHNQARLR